VLLLRRGHWKALRPTRGAVPVLCNCPPPRPLVSTDARNAKIAQRDVCEQRCEQEPSAVGRGVRGVQGNASCPAAASSAAADLIVHTAKERQEAEALYKENYQRARAALEGAVGVTVL
jgi:hypothetical protein